MHTKYNPCTKIRTLECQTVLKYALIYKTKEIFEDLISKVFQKKDSSFILLIFLRNLD